MHPPRPPAPAFQPNLTTRISVVVTVAIALAAAALTSMHYVQQRSLESLLDSEMKERANILERGLQLTRRPLLDFTSDYSPWDDMLAFARQPDPKWSEVNLEPSLERFKLFAVWVVRSDGTIVHTSSVTKDRPPPLPFPGTQFVGVEAPPVDAEPEHWFVRQGEALLELAVAPIQPSEESKAVKHPPAWLVVATAWGPDRAKVLSELVQGEVRLASANGQSDAKQFIIRRPLVARSGQVVETLVAAFEPEELRISVEHQRIALRLFVVALIVTGSIVIGAIYVLVVRPVRLLQESLAADNPDTVAPLLVRSDEFGHLARLVRSAAEQRAALAAMLDERARLGRDLHDGVIQNLYATGMGIAALRGRLNPDQAVLGELLDEARATINETIRDVRNFIDGLEPEALRTMSFADALRSLADKLRRLRPFVAHFEIDDAVAEGLTPKQRLNLLQVAREAMSNALRHGAATDLYISLRRDGAHREFGIVDNGRGFDSSASENDGQGLRNFADRALELNSKLSIQSAPGKGTRVTVTIPA